MSTTAKTVSYTIYNVYVYTILEALYNVNRAYCNSLAPSASHQEQAPSTC